MTSIVWDIPEIALTLIKTGPGGLSSTRVCSVLLHFYLTFTKSKLTSPVFAWCVIDAMASGNCPEQCGTSCPLRKSERVCPTENLLPPTLCTARDRKLIGILTGAVLDCRPQPGRTSHALGWSVIAVKRTGREGVGRVAPRPDFWQRNVKLDVKTSFFDVS
jgi:hypothetical protein